MEDNSLGSILVNIRRQLQPGVNGVLWKGTQNLSCHHTLNRSHKCCFTSGTLRLLTTDEFDGYSTVILYNIRQSTIRVAINMNIWG